MSRVAWQTELLALLGAPPTPANYRFLNQWAAREHSGGAALSDGSNNPFFTTAGAGGTVGPLKAGTFPSWNSIGVARYPNIGVGVYANALHIGREYPAIAQALRSGNPAAYQASPAFQNELTAWSGGGYSGFAAINAPAAPVGPTVDPHQMMVDVGNSIAGKPPSGGGGGIGGVVDSIAGAVGQAGSGNPIGGAVGAIGSLPGSIPGVKQAEAVGSFIGKLTDPSYILRGLQVVAGAGLVAAGVVLLARQVALAADVPTPVAAGVNKAGLAGAVE